MSHTVSCSLCESLARRVRDLEQRFEALPEGAPPERDALIGREQAAEMLGVSVSKLDKLAAERALHPVRVGRSVRYDPRALREYASRRAQRTRA